MNRYKTLTIGLFFVSLLLPACNSNHEKGVGAPVLSGNPSTIVRDKVILPGDARCPNGGIEVDAGIDENGNGILDPEEVDVSEVVCNGVDGATGATGPAGSKALMRVSDEPSGENCAKGGSRIEVGLDANGNGILDSGEINAAMTRYICLPVLSPFKGLVFSAEKNLPGMRELFRTEADGSGIIKLAGAPTAPQSVEVFIVSPDKTRVAFIADFETNNVIELFVVNLMDGTRPVKVSAPLASGGNVSSFFSWSPDGKRIVYGTRQEGVNEIFTAFADGTGAIKVNGPLVSGGTVFPYYWSPDSTRIAYLADQETAGLKELFTVFPDGTGNVKVNAPLSADETIRISLNIWSPDSTALAYVLAKEIIGSFSFVTELFTASPDGTGNAKINRPLFPGEFVANYFSWSPNGARIAHKIVGKRNNSSFSELYTSFPDGTALIEISGPLPPDGGVGLFSWSPDSSSIAFLAGGKMGGSFNYDLFTTAPDGSNKIKIAQALLPDEDLVTFKWSPNSRHIAYRVAKNVNRDDSLFVTDSMSGSSQVKINNPVGGVGDFFWSPDGSRIAYELHDEINNSLSLGLFTTFPDGTGNTMINGPLVSGGRILRFSWSADNTRIAYEADQETHRVFELFTALPDGTAYVKVSGPLVSGGKIFGYSW